MPDATKMAAYPPVVLGPSAQKRCDFCQMEPAEHQVHCWSAVTPDTRGKLSASEFVWDLCGTCLLIEQKEAQMTYEEHEAFWDERRPRGGKR